jgi:hypothetical protein
MSNLHTDLDRYKDQWEKALEDGFLDNSPHLPPKKLPDFFGQWDGEDEPTTINECDVKYWQQVYALSSHQGQAPLPIQEEVTKDEIKKKTVKMATASNPILPSSVGKDQEMKVTANWSDGKELRELSDLKMRLEKLESQMNAKEGLGQKTDSMQAKIDSLKQQIDELSDSMGNNRTGEEN